MAVTQSAKAAGDLYDRSARAGQRGIGITMASAVAGLQTSVTARDIRAALELGNGAPIFNSSAWADFELEVAKIGASDGPMWRVVRRAIKESVPITPLQDPFKLRFEPVWARSKDWIDREGSRLVTVVSQQTKDAINDIIKDAYTSPETKGFRMAAQEILKNKQFGLNRPQQRSFTRFVEAARTRQLPGYEDLTGPQIQYRIDQRYKRMRRQRAELVAKTESYNAAGGAQRELWDEAVSQGQLNPQLYVLEWITRGVGVCPRCEALRNQWTEIQGGLFVSKEIEGGGKYDGKRIAAGRPTVHPYCYCALRITLRAIAEASLGRGGAELVRLHAADVVRLAQTAGAW